MFAMFTMAAVGVGAVALDIGRMAVLRTQMQNYADAAAMAGAGQLDGRVGAQTRARAVATNAATGVSRMSTGTEPMAVQGVTFLSQIAPERILASGDDDSRYIQVTLAPREIAFYLAPLLDKFTGTEGLQMNAFATAGSNPFICHAPPLMMCDPREHDPDMDLADPANVGRQVLLKPPPTGGSWTPGNFGLLALPDGSQGASDIEGALAAVSPPDCYTLDVSTAPGVKVNKVQSGINARFGLPGTPPYPAPNVINYLRDPDIEASTATVMGSGDWDIDAYWSAKHGGGVPPTLAGASRYQTYLYELGLTFARSGKRTIYPIEDPLPDGYAVVTPVAEDIPESLTYPDDPDHDGVPESTVAANGYARRLVEVAVLQCVSDQVQGSHTYPTSGNYIEMFLTEAVGEEPAGGIFGEIVRPLNPNNDPDFHANVALLE